jgi:hypothetical protein
VHNLPECKKPITFGWQFSTAVVLPPTPSSWTYVLDQQRVSTQTTAAQVAYAQLQQLVPRLPANTVAVLDRGYNSTWLWCQCSALPIQGSLVRLKGHRGFYRAAPPATGKPGARRKDGEKWRPDDPATHGHPDGTWQGQDGSSRPIELAWWQQMHVKEARWLEVTVIQVVRSQATNSERDPRVSWLVWIGDQQADLVAMALGYALRFSQEHGYRFEKQSLLWDEPRLRTPEQFERWSHLVAIVHHHLVLARDLVETELRPWENKQRPSTPQQVRRGLHTLLPTLGTPARPPKPRGKSPGRIKGAKIRKAPRFSVVRKTPTLPQPVPM